MLKDMSSFHGSLEDFRGGDVDANIMYHVSSDPLRLPLCESLCLCLCFSFSVITSPIR